MSMSILISKLTVFHLILQIYKIKITKEMIFVSRVGFFFFFSMNDLILNDVTLLLGADMLIETYIKYDKLLILRKKIIEMLI
jgi:hypothetical protein